MLAHLPARFAAASATEKLTTAIELLEDEQDTRQLAGIYALDALRRDFPETAEAVVEVLASFVRCEASWDEALGASSRASTVVQAALNTLGRRGANIPSVERPLDLHGMALRNAYLPLVHFEHAFLYDCDLSNALLVGAHLQGAWLGRTNLQNANLDEAHLEGADLSTARNLQPEQLERAFVDSHTRLPAAFIEPQVTRRRGFHGYQE